ncbi:MAG: [acyl-carrier-protein] S-malonyltransferase [Ignavibacteria bacterium RBG_13_36_8]|nr:MAG: [acyl-carrier-protein] S-malonyltransferase [Ignavibacteria bacterium RBG_13_36_8]
MGKRAFIFPGQGSQYVGMAKDLFEGSDIAAKMIREAEETIGIEISKIMFEGPDEALKQTDITQPAIFIHSMIITSLLNELQPEMVAGHSLGEYSALVAAKAMGFKEAVKLVRFRGQFMLQAGIEQPGTMAAVIGLSEDKLIEICKEASEKGIVQCANFNSPGQIVISGSIEGVTEVIKLCKKYGAKLVKQLVVSGAFHSPLMQSASDKLKEKLDKAEIYDAIVPVYANVTAKPTTQKAEIKDLLLAQLNAPVRWEETIINMINDGADEFIEIGPGKVLLGLVKRINPDIKVYGIDKLCDVERFV